MAEAGIGNHFTLRQGIGPTYNIIGYGADIEFDSELIDLYEQFTYVGGLRYYLMKRTSERFYSRGFDGFFFGLHYAVSIDKRSGSYNGKRPPFNYVREMNRVGVFFGWQTYIGKRFYGNVALGVGRNTLLDYYSASLLSQVEFGWRFWEPSFKD